MKILLIAGHGAGDPGAVAKIDGVTYQEAKLTREVVFNLKPLLEQYGATVSVYPTTRNAYADSQPSQHGKLSSTANFKAYDYVLEIHFNSAAKDLGGNGATTGVECFWPSRGASTGVELPITSRIAKFGFRQRQNRAGQLAVINTANGYGVKANLLEVCFVDDADDMRLYMKNRKAVAQAIADGIGAVYKLKKAPFVDIANNAFRSDIEWGISKGITTGYADGSFRPNEACTRGQVVTFLWRFAGCPNVVGTKCPFVDVAASSPYYKAILWAVEKGITNGVDATHFKPNELVTRAQFVTFLWRHAGKGTASIKNPFADISESSVFFKAILWAVERGITNGVDSKHFMPNANCTRAQTMAFLHRYANKEGK